MKPYPILYRFIVSNLSEQIVDAMGGRFMKMSSCFSPKPIEIPFSIMGMNFLNPVGMSSGWADTPSKMRTMFRLGCGIVTAKTITVHPRKGNPRPWIIRKGFDTLINSMGLPNKGVDWWVENYSKSKHPSVLSIRGDTIEEWFQLIEKLESKTDIFELNFSCPNLSDGVMDIVSSKQIIEDIAGITKKKVWLKISPEHKPQTNLELVNSVRDKIDGITAMNTIPVKNEKLGNPTKQGGLSGPSIYFQLTDLLKALRDEYSSFIELPIFAVGGINTEDRAFEILSEYKSFPTGLTGFLTQGPYFYHRIAKYIQRRLKEDNISLNTLLQ